MEELNGGKSDENGKFSSSFIRHTFNGRLFFFPRPQNGKGDGDEISENPDENTALTLEHPSSPLKEMP